MMATVQNTSAIMPQQLGSMFRLTDAAAAQNAAIDAQKAAAGAASPLGASDTENRFLTLLIAQMKNQDPLKPLDNAQVTSQLAQVSTVRGIEQLNQTVGKLLAASGAKSPLDAVSVIGRDLLLPGDQVSLSAPSTGAQKAGFELLASADSVLIDVTDVTGRSVFNKQLGATQPGLNVFDWGEADLPAGNYKLKISAIAGGQPVNVTPYVASHVLGTSQTSNGIQIQLSGGRTVAPADIKAIL